jgi:ADP-ribose pyrophosphatase YjhB (NUDIX family)
MESNSSRPPVKKLSLHPVPVRHRLSQHLTASGVVIANSHALLIHHKRIGAWLPPGGHVENDELPHEAVIREILEETGVMVEILSENLPDTGDPDAFLLPGPLCSHAVRAVEKSGEVYHVDIVYLCRPVVTSDDQGEIELPALVSNEEVHAVAWVPLAKMNEIPLAKNVVEIFALAKSALGLSADS